jgi:hypothetical protein
MKRISVLFLSLLFVISVQAGIPTPDSAMAFYINKDARKWAPQFQDGNKKGFIMEFVIDGDSIKSWKEMVAQQIAFTKTPLRKYVDTWKGLLLKADSKVEFTDGTNTDGSITESYTSISADETSIRRFIQGKDGIYMLAYHVRPKLKDPDIWKIWQGIIESAKLIPNPQK